jgi:hypothetical protein
MKPGVDCCCSLPSTFLQTRNCPGKWRLHNIAKDRFVRDPRPQDCYLQKPRIYDSGDHKPHRESNIPGGETADYRFHNHRTILRSTNCSHKRPLLSVPPSMSHFPESPPTRKSMCYEWAYYSVFAQR